MPYQWVQAVVFGEIDSAGNIHAQTTGLCGMHSNRPRNFAESQADWDTFERLRKRVPGEFKTFAYMGGATSILVPTKSLKWLESNLMERLAQKYGPLGEKTYIAMVRNTGAPTVWNVAEPAGGMAEEFDLRSEQIGETVEAGFYRGEGWLRFVLDDDLGQFQKKLDDEQKFWWSIAAPNFKSAYSAEIKFLPYGNDSLNGQKGCLVAGPVGDFQILSIAELDLSQNGDWMVQDLEARPASPAMQAVKESQSWIPLDRKVVGITPREGRSPMLYEFAGDDGLDECGLHIALSGEALEYNISHLTRATLEMLGWLPKEESKCE